MSTLSINGLTLSASDVDIPSGGTSGGILYWSDASTLSSSGVLAANKIVLGGGAGTTPATLASLGTTTTVLHGNAAGAPTFGAVSLTADVSGILPVANGGTGTSTAFTAGSVVFSGASGVYTQDNADLFWDNTAKQLGVGTATTGARIHAKVSDTGNFTGILAEQASTGNIGYQLLITGVQAYVLAIDHKGGSNNLAITNSSATPGSGNTIITFNTDKTITVPTDAALKFTNQTDGAGLLTGTLTNSPKVGNPTFWLPVSVNGTTCWIPTWSL